MKPLKLTLRGFRGIKAGTGLEKITVDLSSLAGLVAITGPNGAGKTTVIDNLHPYRFQPYKLRESKEWGPNSFSFYDHTYGREAMKELIFEVAGKMYRSLIMIDAEKRKQECYLFVDSHQNIEMVTWIPYNESVKDGKTREYDIAIEELCGSPSLFCSSVFRAQEARKLSSYPRSEILSIVVELLDLEHIKKQGEKAGAVVTSLTNRVASLDAEKKLAEVEADTFLEEKILQEAKFARGGKEDAIKALREDIEELTARRRQVELTAAAEEVSRQRLTDRKAELSRLVESIAVTRRERADTESRLESSVWSCEKALADATTYHATNIKAYSDRRVRLESILSRREEIEAAGKRLAGLDSVIEQGKSILQELREQYAATDKNLSVLSALKGERASAVAKLDSLKKRAEALSGLDCRADGSSWVNEGCVLLKDAVEAKATIPTVEAGIKLLDERLAGIPALESELQRLKAAGVEVAESVKVNEQERMTVAGIDVLKTELDLAESRLAEIATDEQAANNRIQAVTIEKNAELETVKRELASYREAVESSLAERERSRELMAGEVAAIESTLAGNMAQELSIIDNNISRHKESISSLESDLQATTENIGRLTAKIAAAKEKQARADELTDEIARIGAELVNWNVMVKACSNDGIIQLEIDDAGPNISSLTNDLLSACYGPRFSVRFETQAEKRDGGMKEVFDITVYDGERDEEKSIRDMSGGEVTFIEDAITRAFALVNLERTARTFEAIFCDEKDGALDATRKGEFIRIKRKAMEIGTHKVEYFITQTPELIDLADHTITVGKGGVVVK